MQQSTGRHMKPSLTRPSPRASRERMGRPPLGMKEVKVQFPAETLEQIDTLVGDKHRSKFIRAAVDGALATAKQVKPAARANDKSGR